MPPSTATLNGCTRRGIGRSWDQTQLTRKRGQALRDRVSLVPWTQLHCNSGNTAHAWICGRPAACPPGYQAVASLPGFQVTRSGSRALRREAGQHGRPRLPPTSTGYWRHGHQVPALFAINFELCFCNRQVRRGGWWCACRQGGGGGGCGLVCRRARGGPPGPAAPGPFLTDGCLGICAEASSKTKDRETGFICRGPSCLTGASG